MKFWSSKTLELWKRKQRELSRFELDKKGLPWRQTLSENNFTISSIGPCELRVTLDPPSGSSEPVLVREGSGNPLPPAKEDGDKISCAALGMAFGVAKKVRPSWPSRMSNPHQPQLAKTVGYVGLGPSETVLIPSSGLPDSSPL